MQKIYQTTISKKVSFNGKGLHTGNKANITLYPGKADQGIIFKRIDLKENNIIKANYSNVSSAKLCTTLENEHGIKVSTIEHLLASFYILDIDNVTIEINNEEIPIMDGSAKDFIEELKKVEIKSLDSKRKYLKILDKIEFNDGKRKIFIEPDENFKVDFQLNYENEVIGTQRNLVDFENDNLEDVSNSRTFCLYEDIEKIKKAGLAKGGSLENAIVVDKEKVLNEGGLRNDKEFVNHKILDLAGDLVLSGYRILGKVTCHQGGHELTNMFLRKLLKQKSSLKSINLDNQTKSNSLKSSPSFSKLVASA
tara:strand:- start:6004 stop:6930 length:927 start_codon:yes stop_codon:yes gene_type:complete